MTIKNIIDSYNDLSDFAGSQSIMGNIKRSSNAVVDTSAQAAIDAGQYALGVPDKLLDAVGEGGKRLRDSLGEKFLPEELENQLEARPEGKTPTKEITDEQWIRQVMFIPRQSLSVTTASSARAENISRNREFTEGIVNFSDTTLGGNRSINPRPQFTEYADQNVDTLLFNVNDDSELRRSKTSGTGTGGMGRYYYEAVDQNAQRIFMNFGVPQFNSLGNFFSKFYDPDQGKAANTGASGGILYTAGKVIGYMFFIPIHLVLNFAHGVYNIYKFLKREPRSRYYFMKPTMELYWAMVTTIVNTMSVNMGILPDYDPSKDSNQGEAAKDIAAKGAVIDKDAEGSGQLLSDNAALLRDKGLGKEEFEAYQRMLPDIFRNNNGGIDARAVATRYQKLANLHYAALERVSEGSQSLDETYSRLIATIKERRSTIDESLSTEQMKDFVANYAKSDLGSGRGVIDLATALTDPTVAANAQEINSVETTTSMSLIGNIAGAQFAASTVPATAPDATKAESEKIVLTDEQVKAQTLDGAGSIQAEAASKGVTGENSNWWPDAFRDGGDSYWEAGRKDGWAWTSFVVDYSSSISESVSNSTKSSSIAESMNSKSSEARNLMFNVAGGNIGDGVISGMIESVIGGVKNVVQGVANSVGLQGLSALGGAAFADIPDFWDNSSASLPNNNYTIKLISPYGNPMSLFINIYFPLAMLLAGAVPRTTGQNSYTSPFLCSLWHKGRSQIQLGLITDISITRGTSNVAWNIHDQAVAIDVSFSVTNLSKMLHMPISPEVGLKDILGLNLFNESNNFTDYMAVLAGLGLPEQFYHKPNLKRQHVLSLATWDTWASKTNFALGFFHATTPGVIINALSQEAAF